MPKATKNSASKSAPKTTNFPYYPSRVPFRSKDTPINFGELYHNAQGEIFKLVSRTVVYGNSEDSYLLLQSLNEKKATPILVLEDDFKSGIMFEICNRFI